MASSVLLGVLRGPLATPLVFPVFLVMRSSLVAFIYLGLVHATPLANFRVHESKHSIPLGYSSIGPAAPEKTISLRLALVQPDEKGIVDALYSVSDPASAKYGQHLSKHEVETLVTPSSTTKDAVNSWLKANALQATTLSPAGDWINIQVPVSKANSLFNTNFTTFVHQDTGKEVIRTLSYSLPDVLQGHVDLVHPTVLFPTHADLSVANRKRRSFHEFVSRDASTTCANGTTPACLQDLYQIPLTPATQKTNSLGVTGFFGNGAHYSFLEAFLKRYRPDMDPKTNFTSVGIDGGQNDQNAPSVSEGELDIQYTVGLATGVNVTYYFIGIDNQDGDLGGFLDEANYLLSLENPPLVLTNSYALNEDAISPALAQKLCNAYAQLGARGTTILFASGDGAAGCSTATSTQFRPMFPSNCPYVTSVGGTQGFEPEEGWTGSGGGFSNYFPRPSYQDAAVEAYLTALGSENAGRFNASGRAFPDIAAKADKFIIYGQAFYQIYGTSASSPTVASIIALLNDRLLAQGRSPMGFLNPWLYSEGFKALTDITQGNSSRTCSTDEVHTIKAVEGWDPVTGLGTPRFDKLISLLDL